MARSTTEPGEPELRLLQAVLHAGGCLPDAEDAAAAETCVVNDWLTRGDAGYALTLAGADALRPAQGPESTIFSVLRMRADLD